MKYKRILLKISGEALSTLQPGDFDYRRYGGYAQTQVEATGFFRVELVDGEFWRLILCVDILRLFR